MLLRLAGKPPSQTPHLPPFSSISFVLLAPQEAASPALTLDIVPVADKPLTYQVFFQGKSLPKAKGFTYAPNQWMQEFATDEGRCFSFIFRSLP